MGIYIGMDVHSKQTVYVAQDESGSVIVQGSVATTEQGLSEMIKAAEVPTGTSVGLETGTQATWVARLLAGMGMTPVVIDAREVRAKARRIGQKTDRRDAFEICDGLRRGIYSSIVYVPPETLERLRIILSRRRHFVRLRTAQVNAAKFLLRSRGLRELARTMTTPGAWAGVKARVKDEGLRQYLALHETIWLQAGEAIKQLENEMEEAAKPMSEVIERLKTVPGVGPVTATSFVAALGTPERFGNSGQVVSYAGLAVSTYDSGEQQKHGGITKQGNAELRMLLCEAAHHARNARHPMHPYYARITARLGVKRAVVALAQRLARILFQLWKKGENFDETKLNVQRVKKQKTRTVHYEIKKTCASASR